MRTRIPLLFILTGVLAVLRTSAEPTATRETATYKRLKSALDAVPAIDTHDHLWPFDILPGYVQTDRGRGMTLAGLWRNSYFTGVHPLAPWKAGSSFDAWWTEAKGQFANARATSIYRYQWPAFLDLYGIDFDSITDPQAHELNDRVFRNYQDQKWLYQVVTERANIELMVNDPFCRFRFTPGTDASRAPIPCCSWTSSRRIRRPSSSCFTAAFPGSARPGSS